MGKTGWQGKIRAMTADTLLSAMLPEPRATLPSPIHPSFNVTPRGMRLSMQCLPWRTSLIMVCRLLWLSSQWPCRSRKYLATISVLGCGVAWCQSGPSEESILVGVPRWDRWSLPSSSRRVPLILMRRARGCAGMEWGHASLQVGWRRVCFER